MRFNICFWLAWAEWSRSVFRRNSRNTYRYDFFWLTILLVLISVMGLFLWTSKQGVLNKCMDVFLGNVPEYGVPIWLEAQLSPVGGRHLISPEALKKISSLKISSAEAHPYKEVEDIYVKLPDYNISDMRQNSSQEPVWRDKENPDKNAEFNARAVYPQDPLWIGDKQDGLPLEVTLDENLFKKYFDCDAYQEVLEGSHVPENLLKGMPETRKSDSLWCLRDRSKDRIWLSVKVGRERELLRFRINWADRIYTVEKVALLFPMSTFNALLLSHGNPGLRYYPEGEGRITRRFRRLILIGGSDEEIEKFTGCLSGKLERGKIIGFSPPLPDQDRIKACADKFHIHAEFSNQAILPEPPYVRVNEDLEGHQLEYDNDGNIIAPVDALSPDYQEISVIAGKGLAKIDMIEADNGFRYIVVYVKERNSLFETIEELKKITVTDNGVERNALDIHEFSHDAVTRFGFISDIVNLTEKGFLPVFYIFLFFLLFVQIGVVLNHRTYNLGVLLAKGFCAGHIYFIIFLQILFCFLMGYGLGGVILFFAGIPALNYQFEKLIALKNYGEYIDIGDFELLTLSMQDYCQIFIIMLPIVLFVTYFQLRVVMKLKSCTDPSQLLHD